VRTGTGQRPEAEAFLDLMRASGEQEPEWLAIRVFPVPGSTASSTGRAVWTSVAGWLRLKGCLLKEGWLK
jgi:hypothetical protein